MSASHAAKTSIDREALMQAEWEDRPVGYTSVDSILYALGVGFGGAPQMSKETPYVYERPMLKTVPTLAVMLAGADLPGEHGWDGREALPVEQSLELFRPLPAAGNLLANQRVTEVEQIAAGPGTRVVQHTEVRMASDDTALYVLDSTLVSRPKDAFRSRAPATLVRHALPRRDPDLSCDIRTRVDQSLLFRLAGGRQPLYVEAGAAEAAGFAAPLLHSGCLFGIACRAVLRTICDYDYTLITAIEARFSAPLYPGDTVTTDMWQDRNVVSFRCSVKARGTVVISNGKCVLAG